MSKPRYGVSFTPKAERQLAKLPRAAQERIAARIDTLATDPRPHGVEKLKGAEDIYRLRAGEYRVLYHLADDVLLVLVIRVGHRREVYRD